MCVCVCLLVCGDLTQKKEIITTLPHLSHGVNVFLLRLKVDVAIYIGISFLS